MAEGDGAIYDEFKFRLLSGQYDLTAAADQIRLMMVEGHTQNLATHTGYASVSADEVTGPGYTATGEILASQAIVKATAPGRGTFDGDDVLWTGLGPLDVSPPTHVILYDDTHASNLLIATWEVVTAPNGGNFTIQFSSGANLILAIT